MPVAAKYDVVSHSFVWVKAYNDKGDEAEMRSAEAIAVNEDGTMLVVAGKDYDDKK